MVNIAKNLQGVLWSRDISSLDLHKDKDYIIHQVLMFGSLSQIKWLRKTYGKKEIRKVFVKNPRKIYSPGAFNFIKNYLLGVKKDLPSSKYVKIAF